MLEYEYEEANPKLCPRCGCGNGRNKRTLSTKTQPDGPVERYRKCQTCKEAGWSSVEIRRDLWEDALGRIAELEEEVASLNGTDLGEAALHLKSALRSIAPAYAEEQRKEARKRQERGRRGQSRATRKSRDLART